MPVRVLIHSSLVLTIFSRSQLVNFRLGAKCPTAVIFERIHLPPELEPSPVNPGEGIFAALDARALQQPQPFQAYGRVGWRPSGPQGGRILTHRAGLGLIAPDDP
jgi:hypothetical protein